MARSLSAKQTCKQPTLSVCVSGSAAAAPLVAVTVCASVSISVAVAVSLAVFVSLAVAVSVTLVVCLTVAVAAADPHCVVTLLLRFDVFDIKTLSSVLYTSSPSLSLSVSLVLFF